MTTTLTVTLPEPAYGAQGCQVRFLGTGAIVDMADNTLRKHAPANRRMVWALFWPHISEADRQTIETQALLDTEQTFSPSYEDTTYTVLTRIESFVFDRTNVDATPANARYNVWLSVEQSSFV